MPPGPRLVAQLALRIECSRRALFLAAFVPTLLVFLATLRTNPFDISADPVAVVPSAIGVAQHGTPVVPTSWWPSWNDWGMAVDAGHVVSNRTPGLIYLATPLYWVFRSQDTMNELPASLLAALMTSVAIGLLAVLFAKFLSARAALCGALVAAFATTTWGISGTALWPHGPDTLFLVVAMLGLASHRYARTGIAFAATMLIRPTLGIAAAVSGIVESWRTRSLRPALTIGVITAAGAALYWWYAKTYWSIATDVTSAQDQAVGVATHGYGGMLTATSAAAWQDFATKIAGALVSPGRGLFIGSPFLLLLLPGLRRAWRSAPAWVRSCAVSGLVYMLVELKVEIFSGGIFFWSYRYPLEMLVLAAPLLALAWREWTARSIRRRAAFAGLVVFSVCWQAIGAVCFRGPYFDRPWTFTNLEATLTHGSTWVAWTLLICGVAGALLTYLRCVSGGAYVLHVAGPDDHVAVGRPHDEPADVVHVDGGPGEPGVVRIGR